MNRYSVLYLLKGQYHHIGASTHAQAKSIIQNLLADQSRMPVGIYDARTELFEWEPTRQYSRGFEERHDSIITIAQALRRRDLNWQGHFQRPSFFA